MKDFSLFIKQKNTESDNPKVTKTENWRLMILSKCVVKNQNL